MRPSQHILKSLTSTILKKVHVKLERQALDRIDESRNFLYSADQLASMVKLSQSINQLHGIIRHLDHHGTEGIEAFDKVRAMAERKIKSLARQVVAR